MNVPINESIIETTRRNRHKFNISQHPTPDFRLIMRSCRETAQQCKLEESKTVFPCAPARAKALIGRRRPWRNWRLLSTLCEAQKGSCSRRLGFRTGRQTDPRIDFGPCLPVACTDSLLCFDDVVLSTTTLDVFIKTLHTADMAEHECRPYCMQ